MKKTIRRKYNAFLRRHRINEAQMLRDTMACLLGIMAGFTTFYGGSLVWRQIHKPVEVKVKVIEVTKVLPTIKPTATQTPTTKPKKRTQINSGNASYYSIDGCLGCNPGRIMANGQKLDDTKLTLAYNHLPMNTVVTVRNTKTGVSVQATVTDTGGFERHGKIADLSVATRDALDCGSTCSIAIEL